ncbi:cysteine hydrolase family protein [Nocardia sp. CDC153]|uniref:cysteine hydrolase family protein n=1 Tax=Nocardia sp. CDC153 TaxID=3112167 RepID=UPI002DBFFEC1|nr:cysteine hydrolase family protein [Nocardia sp. CDC153]MEC3953087.1 cysteine hydrolase family protein [Nocardia sp. CDC153]
MKRALIVIDVQNEYVVGNLPIAYPPLDISLANIGAAMDAAHAAGIPVILIRQAAPAQSPIFARGSAGFALHPTVTERPHDLVIEKTLPSSFTGTGLADWLAEHDIDTIAICGYMTQNCDESTARDAVHRGFAVEFLADATGTLTLANQAGSITAEDLHRAVLVVLQSRFAAVASTAEWIESVTTGTELARSSIVASTVTAQS